MSESEFDVEAEVYPNETSTELPSSKRHGNRGRNMGIIAGILVVGAGITTALVARFMSNRPPNSDRHSLPVRRSAKGHSGTRRKLPPRRPRSIVSGASSLPQSPTASSSDTPVKSQFRAQGALPSLPPRPKFVARQRSQPPSQSKSETEKDATVPGQQEDVVKERRDKREEEEGEKVVKQESEREINNSTSEDQPEDPLKAAESDVRNAGDTSTVSLTSSLTKDMEPTDSKMSISEPLVPKLDDVTGGETNGEQDNEKVPPLETEKVQPLEPEPKEQPKEEAKQEQEEKGVHADASTGDVSTESPGQEVNHEVDDAEEEEEGAGEEMMEEGKDEEEEGDNEFERIEDIACPALDFSDAPQSSEALTALEERIRSMSIAAHNHLSRDKLTKLGQAIKEQNEALDLALGEGKGKVRPTLVAACAFSLADMQIALRKIEETKASLAIAYAAGKHTENRGPMIRALMNYAYVLRGSGKPRSTRAAYISALDIAKSENGPSHQTVEQIKYEYSSYLAKTGKLGEASQFLLGEADALLAQAEKLDVEEPESEQGKKAGETESHKETETADPGSGLEHIQAEVEAQSDPSLSLKPGDQARHYVMRNLMNAAGLLDNKGDHETAETALTKAVEIAIRVHGENSVHHMNTLYAMGLHYRGRGALQDAIAAFETVLSIMDETIEVYEPELLQNRIAILRDAAVCYDEVGDPVTAVDYATGAVVNAQTLAKIMSANGAPRSAGDAMLEPFWMLLADLKTKAGDAEGAAEARREALRGKLNQGIASRGRSGGGMQRSGGSGLKRNSTGGATRAGGRRV